MDAIPATIIHLKQIFRFFTPPPVNPTSACKGGVKLRSLARGAGFTALILILIFTVQFSFGDIAEESYFLVLLRNPKDMEIVKTKGDVLKSDNKSALIKGSPEKIFELSDYGLKLKWLSENPLESSRIISTNNSRTFFRPFSGAEDISMIQEIIGEVSEANLSQTIQDLQGFQTRYTLSSNIDQSKNYIKQKFNSYGLSVSESEFTILGQTKYNVVAQKTGVIAPEKVIILSAHYDAMDNIPGADDDGSGVAALIESGRIISSDTYKFNYTIRFVAFCGEEQGLVGSREYSKKMNQAGEQIIAVINLDMIGYKTSGKNDFTVIGNDFSSYLVDLFDYINSNYVNPASACRSGVNIEIKKYVDNGAWWGDHSSFWDNGYSAVNISETFNWFSEGFNPYYHSINDTLDKLNMGYEKEVVKVSLAVASEIADPIPTKLVVTKPDGFNDKIVAGENYTIRWKNADSGTISLYYDTDYDGKNGILIAQCNAANESYLWNTSNVPAGNYYVYAKMSDTTWDLSSGKITIFANNLVSVKIYPNPFVPARGHKDIAFLGLERDVELNVYDISGELVFTQKISDRTVWKWKGQNNSGKILSSGTYIFVLSDNMGQVASGKLQIIN